MTDNTIGKLGFGCMRLPKKGIAIDIEQTKKMVDLFMEAGFTYFDTAFVYPGSEEAMKKALVDRYPRGSYQIATKLFAAMVPSEKIAKHEFETSIKRLGAGYIDYYLLHALDNKNYKKYDKMHLWDYVKDLKEKGLIKHYGFSYHGDSLLLEELLTEHPDAEFVQLQINYKDWEDPKIESRKCYETALRHSIPIIVMEPVKGGKLADPPEAVKKLFKEADPKASFASWAMRFVASLDGIMTVLSGMSNTEQMIDNIGIMKDFKPLSDEEYDVIRKARKLMDSDASVPCTACGYCLEGCPSDISIPDIMRALNKYLETGRISEGKSVYIKLTEGKRKASDCIHCRKCEKQCPQHLPITEHLSKACELFE